MANALSNAVRQHHAGLAATAGVAVVYVVGTDTVELTAILLGADIEADDAEGETFSTRGRDFGIAADELLVAGAKVEPEPGHVIQYGGKEFLVAVGDNPRCFEAMDQLGILYRVHTVEQ